MHAGVLPLILVGFLALHIALFRRHGITAHITPRRRDDYFWPVQVLYHAIGCLVLPTIVMLLTLYCDLASVLNGDVPLPDSAEDVGAPADAFEAYVAARPEWYYL